MHSTAQQLLELELELEFYLTKINTLNTYTTRR